MLVDRGGRSSPRSARSASASAARSPWSARSPTTALLRVDDPLFGNAPVDMPLETLLGKPPRMTRDVQAPAARRRRLRRRDVIDVREAALRVLRLPTVADKTFLITIGDRSVGGMISRDPMVGPWQVPVSDVAVTVSDYFSTHGEAMAMGERTPLALLDAAASGRMAVAEAITNIVAADIAPHRGHPALRQLDGGLRRAGRGRRPVRHRARGRRGILPGARHRHPGRQGLAVDEDGVDAHDGEPRKVVAPVSLIVSAFAPVEDVRRTLTPQLRLDRGATRLLLVDLGGGRNRLGGSCLAQVYGRIGARRRTATTRRGCAAFFAAIVELRARGPAARLSRPLRRRPVRDAGRDGLRRALRPRRRAWRPAIADAAVRRALRRRTRRRAAGARPRDSTRCWPCSPRRASARCVHDLGTRRGDRPHRASRRGAASRCWTSRARNCAGVVRDQLPHAGAARQSGLRRARSTSARVDAKDPGPVRALTFDPAEDIAAPYIATRRAAARSRSCASRASTASSRWPRRSIAPASSRPTCT